MSADINWFNVAIWSLIGTWILVIGTLLLMYWQTRTGQHLNSANVVMELRERFDSPRMRAARRHLSDHLLRGAHQDITSVEVVTFFELVGTLTHRKILDQDLVWEAFGTWISAYYHSIRSPVDLVAQTRARLSDPLVWHEFEWLAGRIEILDRKALTKAGGAPGDDAAEAKTIMTSDSRLETI